MPICSTSFGKDKAQQPAAIAAAAKLAGGERKAEGQKRLTHGV
jgi:hypothetical protein